MSAGLGFGIMDETCQELSIRLKWSHATLNVCELLLMRLLAPPLSRSIISELGFDDRQHNIVWKRCHPLQMRVFKLYVSFSFVMLEQRVGDALRECMNVWTTP
ncbi:MAG: hypothetical protein RJA63_2951 [Pseudomonadota bacterium]